MVVCPSLKSLQTFARFLLIEMLLLEQTVSVQQWRRQQKQIYLHGNVYIYIDMQSKMKTLSKGPINDFSILSFNV